MFRVIQIICSVTLAVTYIFTINPAHVSAGDTTSGSFTISLVISNVSVSNISYDTATVSWNTNAGSSSQVYYDIQSYSTLSKYGYKSITTAAPVTSHKVLLSNLVPGTTYHFRVVSVIKIAGVDKVYYSKDYTFTTQAVYIEPPDDIKEVPETPEEVIPPVIIPPVVEPEVPDTTTPPVIPKDERIIAQINTDQEPVALDTKGNSLKVTGNLITVTKETAELTVNIPVTLLKGEKLDSFTDASGLSFSDNQLIIPSASSGVTGNYMLRIVDEKGDLGTFVIIDTEDAIGTDEKATAKVRSIKAYSGFARKNYTQEDGRLGLVSTSITLTLSDLPENGEVKISFSLIPGEIVMNAFRNAASLIGLTDILTAYTIDTSKINLSNNVDILDATIIMTAGIGFVNQNGGTTAFKILRYDPDTNTTQVLDTKYKGPDEWGNAIFEGYSPDGLSVFALIGKKIILPPVTAGEEETTEVIIPETGDGAFTHLWIVYTSTGVIILALVVFFWFIIAKRRRKKNGEEQE
ncbi:MAG: fibronectin type III domain-containing protein [Dehalococcoidales bacterium]|nr:fibronectin type III domain-containing protein [Dehalococcoidales bacterium]